MKEVKAAEHVQKMIGTEFPEVTYEQWVEKSNRVLKGNTVSDYYSETYENITVKPLYTDADLDSNTERYYPLEQINSGWKIAQTIKGDTIDEINKKLKTALDNGQNTISFQILSGLSVRQFDRLFNGIDLAGLPLYIDGKEEVIPFTVMLSEWIKDRYKPEDLSGFIGIDPLSVIMENGYSETESESFFSLWCDHIKNTADAFPNIKTVYVDGMMYGEAGANAVQQLAISLSAAVEYIEKLRQKGIKLEEIFSKIVFGLTVSSEFFMEIAKLRAARYLWSKIGEAYQIPEKYRQMDILARTTAINKSKLDPYTNMLRLGGEAFAAVIGQVQALRVDPYDSVTEKESELGARLSRNVHHLLNKEAKLSAVTDPAGGSYFVESLTKQLIEKAWALFLKMEDGGGLLQALKRGDVQKEITEVRKKRLTDFYRRKMPLIGTNRYVDTNEKIELSSRQQEEASSAYKLSVMQMDEIKKRIQNGASVSRFLVKHSGNSAIEPVKPIRLSIYYEELRYKAALHEEKTGKPLKVTLIGLGEYKTFKPVTDFVSDFLLSGGIRTEIIENQPVAETVKSNPDSYYCICGTDAELENEYENIKEAVQAAKKPVMLSGLKNSELKKRYEEAGIKSFIHSRMNQAEFLNSLLKEMIGSEDN